MTTIVTDGKSIAAEGQMTSPGDYIVSSDTIKAVRTPSGRIVACCGPCGDDELFIDWLENDTKKPRLGGGFAALVISNNEPPRCYYNDCTSQRVNTPYAIGSGATWALAAMDLGKTPEEAVAYACTRDVYSGGKITVLSLDDSPTLRAVA